ncbi:hypothetical protein THS27_19900 [Thalassospira sp. MCCC 1A01428]|nr:hypothetical protein THS27_19900 [Thalassospira sp. MCCC 1A01428]
MNLKRADTLCAVGPFYFPETGYRAAMIYVAVVTIAVEYNSRKTANFLTNNESCGLLVKLAQTRPPG